jgi:hypothetical protein
VRKFRISFARVALIDLVFNRTLDRHERWLDSNRVSPFSSIRHYQKIVWQAVSRMVARPRILFFTADGPDFEFDGRYSSATLVSEMLVKIFDRAEKLLNEELLLGLTDEELGVSIGFEDVVDELADEKPGYGFLNESGFRKSMQVLKVFMSHPTFRDHFYVREGRRLIFIPGRCKEYLGHIEELKELLYVLIHFLAGMPKRGSEECRIKIFNILERVRNLFRMLKRLALIGNYAKTSALEEADRMTLHFVPSCITQLILRFYALVADIEKRFVNMFCPNRRENWDCYLFCSFGQPWTSDRLTRILRRETEKYMGISYGLSPLRHLLPAIAEHYNLMIPAPVDTVGDHQQAHSRRLAGRIYSRTFGGHPKLTNPIILSTMSFCDGWQRLMGFSSNTPRVMSPDDMYAASLRSPADIRDSELAKVVKEFLSLLMENVHGDPDQVAGIKLSLAALDRRNED